MNEESEEQQQLKRKEAWFDAIADIVGNNPPLIDGRPVVGSVKEAFKKIAAIRAIVEETERSLKMNLSYKHSYFGNQLWALNESLKNAIRGGPLPACGNCKSFKPETKSPYKEDRKIMGDCYDWDDKVNCPNVKCISVTRSDIPCSNYRPKNFG